MAEVKLPSIETGDTILIGKFKNRKAEVKGLTTDSNNQPVIKTNKGDVNAFKFRVAKLMPGADKKATDEAVMFTYSEFLEEQESASLYVFDIDETLFKTAAKIHVVRDGKVVKKLTNQEFNEYKLPAGAEFDFSEFRDSALFKNTSLPIQPMINKIVTISRNINNAGSRSKIIMNTARADFDSKEPVLQKFRDHGVDIDKMHIHRSGNVKADVPVADKKNVILRPYLDSKQFRKVELWDDSSKNLSSFLSLRSEYPGIIFRAWLVGHNGETKKYG